MSKRLVHVAWLALLVPAIAYAQPGPPPHGEKNGAGPGGHGPTHTKGPGSHLPPGHSGHRPPGQPPPGTSGQHPPGQPPPTGSGHRPPEPGDTATPPNHGDPHGTNTRPPHRRHGPDRAKEIIDARKNLDTARKKAREESRDDVGRRYANAKDQDGRRKLRQELTLHAQRMARLARLREIAQQKGDTAGLARIDALSTKENQRHEQWLSTNAPAQ